MNAQERNNNRQLSSREKHYYSEVLPKLAPEIQKMNLGIRINTCLVSAGIFTLDELKQAINERKHIPMLSQLERKDIQFELGLISK